MVPVWGNPTPDAWLQASTKERAAGKINNDMAILRSDAGARYFVRGHVVVAVHDDQFPELAWSVWVELHADDMSFVSEHWDDPYRAHQPPRPARLTASTLPYTPTVVDLEVLLQQREPGVAPLIFLDAGSEHPLALEQARGIDIHRAAELDGSMRTRGRRAR